MAHHRNFFVKFFQSLRGYHIGQKLVQTDQSYQSHQLPIDLDTCRRKTIPLTKGGPRFLVYPPLKNTQVLTPTLLLDCTKSFLNHQNTSSQKFLNRQNFLSSPNILSRFCHFLGPPEYSDELEFSPPEYSDDLEFSDISDCWFWTKNFVIKNYCYKLQPEANRRNAIEENFAKK